MAIARFHPQAWINDYATEVDAEGSTEWEVGVVPDDMLDDGYDSDDLRSHANAPSWAKDWSGPFYIEIIRDALL